MVVFDGGNIAENSSLLLLATNNGGKIREYRSLLQELPVKLVTLAEQSITVDVEEVGGSMEENARLKAMTLSRESGLPALADDSGLEVDALGGEPGVLSARYAGEGASDSERADLLLSRMEGVPWEERSAHFRCVIAVAMPDGRCRFGYGDCPGMILFQPEGSGGFGYDPVFYIPSLDKTMARLSLEEKNAISHRGKAVRELPRIVLEFGL